MKAEHTTVISIYRGRPALHCTYQGKVCYLEHRFAKDDLRKIREHDNQSHKIPCRTYECPHCGYWHLTSLEMQA